jgi:hypothetical protein
MDQDLGCSVGGLKQALIWLSLESRLPLHPDRARSGRDDGMTQSR